MDDNNDKDALRKKSPYSELFWSAFSRIRTEYGKMRTRITPNTDTFYPVIILIVTIMKIIILETTIIMTTIIIIIT